MRPETNPAARPYPAGGQGRKGWIGAIARVLRQVIGAPDYGTYVEHCRRAGHAARLSEREYVSEFFERKGKTARCC